MSKWNSLFSLLFLLLIEDLQSQIQWQEDFSNRNFSSPKQWLGDTNSFDITSNGQLQLNANGSPSPISLSTSSQIGLKASWEFQVRLEFSPSSSNYAEVYLMSDHQDLSMAQMGYFIRIGGVSGSVDDVSLYKKVNGSVEKIIDGRDGVAGAASVELKIRVERDSTHKWQLYSDSSAFPNFIKEGETYDSSFKRSSFFGIKCHFTATRADKFFFDNFTAKGWAYSDTDPPIVQSLSVIDSTTLEISFNEAILSNEALNTVNYRILETNHSPVSARYSPLDSSTVLLSFLEGFPLGRELTLEVSDIQDQSGNTMLKDTVDFLYFQLSDAIWSDIVISEIFADPVPSVGLPEAEFVEIFNRSNKFINLENWSLIDPTGGGLLPHYILPPKEYLILCNVQDTSTFSIYGNTIGLAYFPSLNNSGDDLELRDASRSPIHKLSFRSSWYHNQEKSNGGWSIELINPYLTCMGEQNFSASTHLSGGTPGFQNSIYDSTPDLQAPQLLHYSFITATTLFLEFNELLDSSLLLLTIFQLEENQIIDISMSLGQSSVYLELMDPIDSGIYRKLSIDTIWDCEGNALSNFSISTIVPSRALKTDVVINELLFNPHSGGSDFVELYNRSDKILTLHEWSLTNHNFEEQFYINSPNHLFLPGEYWVITENPQYVWNYYPSADINYLLNTDLPSFNDDEGSIFLFNRMGQVVDEFSYSEEMHFELLTNVEGVSLERIDPEEPSISSNFFSASEMANFGTPTLRNSQYSNSSESATNFKIRNESFSPDHDGFEDLLFIDYYFEAEGFAGSINIYDARGRRVKELINNQLFSRRGSLRWDGLTELNTKAPIGIYVLLIQTFHITGKVEEYRLPFVLAGRLE